MPSHRPGSDLPSAASQFAVTRGRAEHVAIAPKSLEPILSFCLVLMMIAALIGASWGLHKIAHVIVTEFGALGGVIGCGVIYATSLIMDPSPLRRIRRFIRNHQM